MNPLYRNDRPGQYPNSWYAATSDPGPERAPLRGETRADVAIVGAGFTGLTAALKLAQRGFDVAVIDAHRVGFGASGRNGGQCGSGFNIDQITLEQELGDGPARALWDLSQEAKAQVRALASDDALWRPGVAEGCWTARECVEEQRYA
ncbi:MAG: FAD-binding oxidoreductase, partial [Pseudomonadota bacterium]